MTPRQVALIVEDDAIKTLAESCNDAKDYPGQKTAMTKLEAAYYALDRFLIEMAQKDKVTKKS